MDNGVVIVGGGDIRGMNGNKKFKNKLRQRKK